MRSSPLRRAVWLLVALAGCVSVAPRPPFPELTTQEVARLLAAPLASVRTMQAGGVLWLTDDGRLTIAEILLVLDADQGLRLDALAPFGFPLYTLAIGRDEIAMHDHRERIAWVGPATAAVVKRLLQFEIEPALLLQAAAGGIRRDEPPWRPVRSSQATEKNLDYYQSADWRVGVDPEKRRPAFLEIQQAETLRIAWRDPQKIGGASVARRIEIERPQTKQSLVLKLTDVRINEPVDRALLRPPVPEGWRVRRLGDLGQIEE